MTPVQTIPKPVLAGEAPTPAEVDDACRQYSELKDQLEQARLAASEIAEQVTLAGDCLRHLVGKYGSAHAEKSKLLHGLKYEAMCSYGQEVKIDASAVEQFRIALTKAGQPGLLRRLFEKTVRWTLKAQASEIVRSSDLPDKFRALYARCEVINAKTPVLKVREKSA